MKRSVYVSTCGCKLNKNFEPVELCSVHAAWAKVENEMSPEERAQVASGRASYSNMMTNRMLDPDAWFGKP